MDVPVTVYLNESEDHFFGYEPGCQLREAAAFVVPSSLLGAGRGPNSVLELVFSELNVDYPSEQWARDYRTRRNRSLSVGDVVQIGESAYAVAGCGWDNVALQAGQIATGMTSQS